VVIPTAVGEVMGVDEVEEGVGNVGDPVDDGVWDCDVLEVPVSEAELLVAEIVVGSGAVSVVGMATLVSLCVVDGTNVGVVVDATIVVVGAAVVVAISGTDVTDSGEFETLEGGSCVVAGSAMDVLDAGGSGTLCVGSCVGCAVLKDCDTAAAATM